MRRMWTSVLSAACLFVFAVAHAQPVPGMPDSVQKFWKRVARANAITYTMKYWDYDYLGSIGARPDREIFYVCNTYAVKAQRPNRLSVSMSPGIEREVIEGGLRHKEFINPGGERLREGLYAGPKP